MRAADSKEVSIRFARDQDEVVARRATIVGIILSKLREKNIQSDTLLIDRAAGEIRIEGIIGDKYGLHVLCKVSVDDTTIRHKVRWGEIAENYLTNLSMTTKGIDSQIADITADFRFRSFA